MGKGGAQLGKSLKGKTKPPEQQAQEEQKEIVAEVAEAQLEEDIKQLEEYERLAKIAEEHRLRLKKMAAEEALNTRLNRALLLNMQRRMMRTEKVETLKRDLQLLEQQYTQTAERKDSIIHLLSQDLDDLHAQFEHAQRAHMGKMTKLLTLHNSRVRQLEAECERDLKELRTEFESEREQLLSSHTRQVHELTSVINAVESEERRRADEARQAHETEREEIRNKNLEDINMLRIHLENKISDLERQFDEAHANYLQHTDAANKQFKKLVRKDKTLTKQIEAQKNRITRCQAKLALWKKTISQNEQECSERNQALRQQKELIAKHCQEMERKMKSQRSEESSQLSELSQWSRDALKANQERLAEAENIIKLAELTRKLETERETVAPFYESSVSENELKSAAHEMNELRSQTATPAPADDSSEYEGSKSGSVTPNQWNLLENFYKRYNKALLDKLAIEQEKARLMGENSQLRTLIKQYLDGISVTAEAVDNANPLLIVNGRVNIAQDAQPVRRKAQPTTDAVMTVRAYAKQRA